MRSFVVAVAVIAAGIAAVALLLGGWFLVAAGATSEDVCAAAELGSSQVPAELVSTFARAAATYGLGPEGPPILAGLTKVESDFGRNVGPSSAGAVGWTQFMPETWRRFGVDGDGDGARDPLNPTDAIFSAANYLAHLGAPADWRRALFGYNHANSYVRRVLAEASRFARGASGFEATCLAVGADVVGEGQRLIGGGTIVSIPGQPGEAVDDRILPDVLFLQRRFRFTVTDGFAPTGHDSGGEHPLGLAVDVVPLPGGSWDDIDDLARWAEPSPDHPRPPFRWVGYDGDAGHGRGDHLHLSWRHGPAPSGRPPAPWVDVLVAGDETGNDGRR